jgi:hypothetical protein
MAGDIEQWRASDEWWEVTYKDSTNAFIQSLERHCFSDIKHGLHAQFCYIFFGHVLNFNGYISLHAYINNSVRNTSRTGAYL